METDIGRRLRNLSKIANISISQIAREIGVSKDNLYKWTKGHKPSNIDQYSKLKEYIELMEARLAMDSTWDPPTDSQETASATIRLPLDPTKPAIQEYNGKAAAGTLTGSNYNTELIVDRIEAPFLGIIEGAVEVEEDSMEPTFRNGCRVAIFRLRYPRLINWGTYYYILDLNRQGIIRRIYPASDDTIKLVADHPDQLKYPPITRLWAEILAIFRVKAAIQKL